MPTRGIFLILAIQLSFFTATHSLAQDTTFKRKVTTVKDTTIILDSDTVVSEISCNEGFFESGQKLSNTSKTILVTKAGKTMTLDKFTQSLAMFPDHVLADLDSDGKKELLVTGFTGGAHCCDQLFVFRNTGLNKYQHVVKTFAGNTCINEKNLLAYDFYELFGYFFTCYACAYFDSTDAAPIPVSHITLKYNKGKVQVVPGDRELKSRIRDNLAKLSEQPYESLADDIAQDNGLRKAFALNLVVYYYSFGRNLAETKRLFDQYYKYPDAKTVWTEFIRILNWVKKENDF